MDINPYLYIKQFILIKSTDLYFTYITYCCWTSIDLCDIIFEHRHGEVPKRPKGRLC